MQNNCSNQEVTYAGFWVRVAAYCIDSIVVFVGLLMIRLVMAGIMSALDGTLLGGNVLFHYDLRDIVLYVFHVLYFILFTYYTGTTLGKKAMNLRVIGGSEEEKPGLLDIVYRETIGRFLCNVTMGIGYIFAGVDKEKRGLHDMLCDTKVVYGKKVKVYAAQAVHADKNVQTQMQEPVQPIQKVAEEHGSQPQWRPPRAPEGGYSLVKPEDNPEEKERNS